MWLIWDLLVSNFLPLVVVPRVLFFEDKIQTWRWTTSVCNQTPRASSSLCTLFRKPLWSSGTYLSSRIYNVIFIWLWHLLFYNTWCYFYNQYSTFVWTNTFCTVADQVNKTNNNRFYMFNASVLFMWSCCTEHYDRYVYIHRRECFKN